MLSTLVNVLVVSYFLVSAAIAVCKITDERKYERAAWDLPYGNLEYYRDKPVLLDKYTLVFLPAGLIIIAWVLCIHTINRIISG